MRRNLVSLAIAAVCISTAMFVEKVTTPPPQDRHIAIQAFRYGVEPSVIRVNRGDRLKFTFSSRDTAHSFFLQDYDIDAKMSPSGSNLVELYDPRFPEQPGHKTRQVELTAGRPGLLGQLNTVSRHRCHTYCGPMHGFEQGDLIVRPNWLFAWSLGLLIGIPIAGVYRAQTAPPAVTSLAASFINLSRSIPGLQRILKWRGLQFYLTLPVLGAFLLAILSGVLGTKVGGRNFAVMATWVVWMFVMAVLLVGINSRAWCTICPLPVLGEYLQRGSLVGVCPNPESKIGNRFWGLGWKWPRFLRGAWLRQLMFLCIGTIAASFAGMPNWTAMMLLILFAIATVVGLFWERRTFCRFICPVTSFLNVYSPAGRAMVTVEDHSICRKCSGKDCFTGNANGWGCPFNLCVPALRDNADCGVCTECFKSCPVDNVIVAWLKGPMRQKYRSTGQAWQVLAMLTLGMAYSLIILSPWPKLRDVVNIVDRSRWPIFLAYVAVLWSCTLFVIPGLYWLANRVGMRLAGVNLGSSEAFRRFAPAFVPMGLGFWVSFFTTMMMVNYTFVLLTVADPGGWGWDFLGISGLPWLQLWPAAIPWIQTGLVLMGLIYSLRRGYRLWLAQTGNCRRALLGFVPTAGFLTALATVMVVYFSNF